MSVLAKIREKHQQRKEEIMTLEKYLERAKSDPSMYASAAERMIKAIGEPELVDTSKDLRLRIIHGNQIIKRYKAFAELFGMEETIDRLVSFFKHAAQGLEESRQILNLHGPVGSAKSTLAEILKKLMEQEAIYVLVADGVVSPVFESPLGLFSAEDVEGLNIPSRYFRNLIPSPWAVKRLKEFDGDISKFSVKKFFPSRLLEIAIAKTVAGDENTQDSSVLVGKAKLRALGKFDQSDPDAYDFSGGLSKANQGLLEMIEMQKGNIKTLNPLLTATQESNYVGTESIGAIPFTGLVIAHTNDTEWEEFRNNKLNEALVDRIYPLAVGYNLRVDDEVKIYQKLIQSSSLANSPCAPGVLEGMAQFSILTRLDIKEGENGISKMKVYNGESMKAKDPHAKTHAAYKQAAARDEGFKGVSTREAYKILARVFNFDLEEVAANPVHLLKVLKDKIKEDALPKETETFHTSLVDGFLTNELLTGLEEDVRAAYVDAYDEFGQNLYDHYVLYADFWLRDDGYRDPNTGHMFDRQTLDLELAKIETKANVSNPKEFRQEVVDFSLRFQSKNHGKNPDWKSYEMMKRVIDQNITENIKDILPVISTTGSPGKDAKQKNSDFLKRMKEKGYTEKQVKVIVDFIAQKK